MSVKKIHESHITNSGQKRDAFRYLMEDADESSSENNIEVLGIRDFSESPHQINKKAYSLKLLFEKGSPNQYRSRLGFNLYKLPVGYYTMVVEWFPPEMNDISVTAQGTTISISNHTTKTFEKYTKTVINFHRWGSSAPQFLYLDLHGTVSNPSFLTIGHLIVYGVRHLDQRLKVFLYDTAFVIENGKMVMETDLDMNNNKFKNVPQPTSNTDVLTKGSVKRYYIMLYGSVNPQRVFIVNSIPIRFKSVFIHQITLIHRQIFTGVSDRIIINFRNTQGNVNKMNYRFIYTMSQVTTININHHFIGEISKIETNSTFRVSFVLSYTNIYI